MTKQWAPLAPFFYFKQWLWGSSAPQKKQNHDRQDESYRKELEEKAMFDAGSPPPFKIGEIRAAIPAHCWVKSPWRSMSYVLRDFVMIAALAAVAMRFDSCLVMWPFYWFAQGTMFWALFVLGHDW